MPVRSSRISLSCSRRASVSSLAPVYVRTVAYMRTSLRPRDWRLSLLAPPAGRHLGVLRVVAGAEGEVLAAFGAGLHVSHRVLAEADRVPLLQLDDLVVDLHARRAAEADVDLLLVGVLVPARDPEARLEREQAEPERLPLDRAPGESRLHLGGHVELRRRVLDFAEVGLRVGHQLEAATAPNPTNIPPETIRTVFRRRRMKPPIVPPASAYAPSDRRPSATQTSPSTPICAHTVPPRSTNCGRNARKNSAVFGLRTLTTTPCPNTRLPERGARAGTGMPRACPFPGTGASSCSSHFLIPR